MVNTADVISLTGDELTAIAHGLGAGSFPGVGASCYDAVGPELHSVLDHGFLMSLVARGLLAPDEDGVLQPSEELAVLIGAVGDHRAHLSVEQTISGSVLRWEVMTSDAGVVRHLVDDPIHLFALDPAGTDLAVVLADLVDRSEGCGESGRRRRCASKAAGLDDVVQAPEGGWRRVTRLARADVKGGARVDGSLAILDGGPGQIWLVHEDDADDVLVATPVSDSEVDAALKAMAVHGN
ncbi:hypothetical protein [Acrocarpospora sp. B8E8]|uniref:hypothetical protein n=1 Tax=Acrocarpospora sp. B8E8 TaxID=3153572 RepID=UPI00325E4855